MVSVSKAYNLKALRKFTWSAGALSRAEPADACTPLTNSDINGAIALIDRGTCSFVEKALAAQHAGAIGIIVANNRAGEPFFAMGFDQQHDAVTLAAVMVTQEVGNELQQALVDAHETLLVYIASVTILSPKSSVIEPVTMEQHVYVPDATQLWFQNHEQLAQSADPADGAVRWQALMLDLAAAVQSTHSNAPKHP